MDGRETSEAIFYVFFSLFLAFLEKRRPEDSTASLLTASANGFRHVFLALKSYGFFFGVTRHGLSHHVLHLKSTPQNHFSLLWMQNTNF